MKFAWEWVVPIVVMIFYAISAIIKAKEENEGKPNQKPGAARGGTELDRFLEEIERLRREKSAAATDEFEQPVETPPPRPTIILPPRPVVIRQAPVAPTPRLVIERIDEPRVPSPSPAVAPRQRIVAVTKAPRPRTMLPAIALLKNPQTITTAMVLNEVLGPPKCRRGR